MKTFDLHCHVSLKPMFQLPGEDRLDCWQTVRVAIDNPIGNIVDSQSNLSQISAGCTNLVCTTLHPLEESIAKRSLLQKASYLMERYISREQLHKIASGETPYLQLLKEEYENLTRVLSNPDGKSVGIRQVKVLKNIEEYDPEDAETLHLIICVEGAHAFYYGKNEVQDVHRVLQNLEQFVRNKSNPRILYLTVTHLSQNIFCNHAFGIKIFSEGSFIPAGNGLEDAGKKLIRMCYSGLPDRILIDIKHMSLKSRLMLYEYRRENGWEAIPLIASHVGVTGCSYKHMPERKIKERQDKKFVKVVYEKPGGYLPDTLFNPSSINLYDEDIEEVLRSGGLIGVSFDERILGAEVRVLVEQKVVQSEYVSIPESELFCSSQVSPYDKEDEEEEELEKEEEDEIGGILGSFRLNAHNLEELHMRHLLNNIFHIVKVGAQLDGINPWKHICIGSDFDGLINAIKTCPSSNCLIELPDKLKPALSRYADVAGVSIEQPDEVVEDIMFRNGYRILEKHFV